MTETIRVGLIGYGIAGQVFHAPLIICVNGLELAKIKASRPEQISLARERYPNVLFAENNEEIINDPAIQLVVVATPNDSHYSLAKAALLAGKHVVVEKPFTITSRDADELVALAVTTNRLLTVNHNRRFDGDFETIRKLINSGLLGELVEFESHYDRFRNYLRPNAWREEDIPGAGILYDLGVHLVDQVQILFGLPKSITADTRLQRTGARATDNFELILDYGRLKVTLKGGMLIREPLPRFILLGEKGSFVKYGTDVQEAALRAGAIPRDMTNWGVEPESAWGKINTEHQGMHIKGNIETDKGSYVDFYQNVYESIIGKSPLIIQPVESRNTIVIIEKAIESSQQRKTIDFLW